MNGSGRHPTLRWQETMRQIRACAWMLEQAAVPTPETVVDALAAS